MKHQRIFNRRNMLEARRVLRVKSTLEENILWSKLKNKKLRGLKFRRQYSIGQYITDFYCPSAKLAIELDEPVHEGEFSKEREKLRDEFINSFNIKILRFSNEDISNNIDYVLGEINKAI